MNSRAVFWSRKSFSIVAPKSGLNHPFHIHGQAFYVMDMGQYAEGQTAQELLNFLNSNVKRMSHAPALKDTIAVPSGGYTVIKFKANNPGKLSFSIYWNNVWWDISMLVSRVGCDSPLMLLLLWSSISSNRLNALFEGLDFYILKV